MGVIYSVFLFRSLKCDRTRIHRNLFIAIIIHVLMSLCIHTDEFIAKSQTTSIGGSVVEDKGTLSNTVSAVSGPARFLSREK